MNTPVVSTTALGLLLSNEAFVQRKVMPNGISPSFALQRAEIRIFTDDPFVDIHQQHLIVRRGDDRTSYQSHVRFMWFGAWLDRLVMGMGRTQVSTGWTGTEVTAILWIHGCTKAPQ